MTTGTVSRRGFAVRKWLLTSNVWLLALCLGLLLRLPSLENRPFHADESVHAMKFRDLWERGRYRYDPDEYHGPTIYYAALPVAAVKGRHSYNDISEADYRTATVLFGVAMLLLLPLLADGLGRFATFFAALLLTVSPAFVFYSRYFIQEVAFVFFSLATIAGFWRYRQSGNVAWVVGAGIVAGGAVASKETAVLSFAAALIAALIVSFRQRPKLPPNVWRDMGIGGGTALFTAIVLLSCFFTNLSAPVDYLRSYLPWLTRAAGTELHQQPADYYLRLLLWWEPKNGVPLVTEAFPVLLAIVGGTLAWFVPKQIAPDSRDVTLPRFLSVYTLLLTVAYSTIPYKTPWCVLSFLLGILLLAGVGAGALWNLAPGRLGKTGVGLGLLLGIGHLGWQGYQVAFVTFADERNPYVYAQTARELPEVAQKWEALARAHPQPDAMVVQVMSLDGYYWPVPWYLRRFSNVGYWVGQVPDTLNAPVILASADFDEVLTKRLDATHLMTGFFALRPGVLMQTWVRLDLWAEYLKQKNAGEDMIDG